MKIEVTYFKQSGKYYMEEQILIPDKWISNYEEAKNCPTLLSEFTYNFRVWFKEEIQHEEFTGVVLTDYDNFPEQSEMLGFPMMIHPKRIR